MSNEQKERTLDEIEGEIKDLDELEAEIWFDQGKLLKEAKDILNL